MRHVCQLHASRSSRRNQQLARSIADSLALGAIANSPSLSYRLPHWQVVDVLAAGGVKFIAMRCAGFDRVRGLCLYGLCSVALWPVECALGFAPPSLHCLHCSAVCVRLAVWISRCFHSCHHASATLSQAQVDLARCAHHGIRVMHTNPSHILLIRPRIFSFI